MGKKKGALPLTRGGASYKPCPLDGSGYLLCKAPAPIEAGAPKPNKQHKKGKFVTINIWS